MFLYTSNEKSGNEIKKTISFIIPSKILKGINVKEMDELYTEIPKHCWKKLKP